MANDVVKIFEELEGIIRNDHIVLTSGKHSDAYIRKDRLYPHTKQTSKICAMIAKKVADQKIDVVVSPALAGIVLSQWTAYHLSEMTNKDVLSLFTEKHYEDGQIYEAKQIFKRGYDKFVKGKRVLIVEDLTSTGSSVKKVVNSVKKAGGQVIAVYVLVNRNPKDVNSKFMGAPFYSLATLEISAYDKKSCPMCKKNIPINIEIGHGKEYLKNKKNK